MDLELLPPDVAGVAAVGGVGAKATETNPIGATEAAKRQASPSEATTFCRHETTKRSANSTTAVSCWTRQN